MNYNHLSAVGATENKPYSVAPTALFNILLLYHCYQTIAPTVLIYFRVSCLLALACKLALTVSKDSILNYSNRIVSFPKTRIKQKVPIKKIN